MTYKTHEKNKYGLLPNMIQIRNNHEMEVSHG